MAWTEKYLTLTALQRNPNNYLISRLAHTKRGHNPIGRRSLSYSRIRENFLQLLAPVWAAGRGIRDYGMHSLRSGGASAADNNDVSDRLIGKRGRWSSNTSRDTYIKDNKWKWLSVTQTLALGTSLFST